MSILKKERESLMLTQEEAANSIGISLSLLQKMEQGIRSGNDVTKVKVAAFYGKTVGYLFFNDEITERDNKPKEVV